MIVHSKAKTDGVKTYLKQRRRGNSYITGAVACGRSLVSKVRRRLKSELGGLADGELHLRCYFETPKDYIKVGRRGIRMNEAFIRKDKPLRPGRLEWEVVLKKD